MILRDAVISEHRRPLIGAKAAPIPIVRSEPEALGPDRDSQMLAPAGAATVSQPEEASRSLPQSRESRLTFEAVAAWLAVQDGETRTACASLLADELMQVHELAKREGFAAGHAEASSDTRRQTDALHATLRAIVASTESTLQGDHGKLTEQCGEIVAEAFAKIAGGLLQTRDAATGAVIEVLKRVKEGSELTIKVSPVDLPILQEEQTKLTAVLAGRQFALVADSRVDLGGCIVESRHGSLDGRFEVQLRELYETLRAARSSRLETA